MPLPFLTPLTADQQRQAGIADPWPYARADRVRFGEIDALGHVNNAAYLKFFETLRVNYLTDYHVHDYATDAPRPRIVVKSVSLDFHAELKIADYIACARTTEMRRTSFLQNYGLYSDGQLKTTGTAVVVFLGADGTKMPLPDDLRQRLTDRDGTTQL